MRTFVKRFAPGVISCALALGASVALAQAERRVAIHFADIGNLQNWRADSTDELYIETMSRKWYRVTFWSPCHGLPFVSDIAFVTEPNGELNAYSSILVSGERCWFKTFEELPAKPDLKGDMHSIG